MKKYLFKLKHKLITLISVMVLTPFLVFSQPPTEAEILASIDAGVSWLVTQQNADSSWGGTDRVAFTGFVLLKLCDYAYEHHYASPFDPAYPYSTNVRRGFNWMFSMTKQAYGVGTGLYMLEGTNNHHENYNAAISLMALGATYTPTRVITSTNPLVNGLTYAQLADSVVSYFEFAQNEWANGSYGGWGYQANDVNWSDNSQSGYSTLGLGYARDNFGAVLPPAMMTKLNTWVDYIQYDANGGSGYNTPSYWVNLLKTGNLLQQMYLLGDPVGTARVQHALSYVSATWDAPGGTGTGTPGWHGQNQVMFCLMKGFESYGIDSVLVGGVWRNWFEEFSTELVASQQLSGSWPAGGWSTDIANTVWALYVLEKVQPAPPPLVPLSDWAIIVAILLIGAFIVIRYQRSRRFA